MRLDEVSPYVLNPRPRACIKSVPNQFISKIGVPLFHVLRHPHSNPFIPNFAFLFKPHILRVDTPNLLFRLFINLYGWSIGLFSYLLLYVWRKTLKVSGQPEADRLLSQRYVLALWHEDLILYFLIFNRVHNQVWMNHPAWFMKPIHVLLYLGGMKDLVLGSSGNSGKQALEKVVQDLKNGKNTVVAVDGPAGPPKVMKPGALLMARNSGLPFVSLNFNSPNHKRIGSWDRKRVPMPFSKVEVVLGKPQILPPDVEITEEMLKAGF